MQDRNSEKGAKSFYSRAPADTVSGAPRTGSLIFYWICLSQLEMQSFIVKICIVRSISKKNEKQENAGL